MLFNYLKLKQFVAHESAKLQATKNFSQNKVVIARGDKKYSYSVQWIVIAIPTNHLVDCNNRLDGLHMMN